MNLKGMLSKRSQSQKVTNRFHLHDILEKAKL